MACKQGQANGKGEDKIVSSDPLSIPPLEERTGELAKAGEWEKTKIKVDDLREKIAKKPDDVKSRLQIATIYLSEARVTANTYYYSAAWHILNGVHTLQPDNFEANVFKSSIAMSLHRFDEAKHLAEKARAANPANAYVYGILVDANVELGNYAEAVIMSDKMQELKPSLEAYSRASYLREIYGDYPGAIEAMKMAVQAGAPGLESTEWARVTLGDLYVNTGKLAEAANEYTTSLRYRPAFPNAEMGLAKVEKAKKNYPAAIEHTKNAIRIVSEASFVAYLADLYELNGEADKANSTRKDIVSLLEDSEKNQPSDPAIKHNANRELANAYLYAGNKDKALTYALNDLKLRPGNIDANELAAWIYYLKGDYSNAKIHADKMLATNTSNADILYKAGVIYEHTGDRAKANQLKLAASTVNPYVDQRILIATR
jgi:tetratricopeptide (TPR) repeat protein